MPGACSVVRRVKKGSEVVLRGLVTVMLGDTDFIAAASVVGAHCNNQKLAIGGKGDALQVGGGSGLLASDPSPLLSPAKAPWHGLARCRLAGAASAGHGPSVAGYASPDVSKAIALGCAGDTVDGGTALLRGNVMVQIPLGAQAYFVCRSAICVPKATNLLADRDLGEPAIQGEAIVGAYVGDCIAGECQGWHVFSRIDTLIEASADNLDITSAELPKR